MNLQTIATGLLLPEGPVALSDGSALIVEVGAGRLSRVAPDGTLTVIAHLGGGPNGAAIGPDGAAYICNNGGGFTCELVNGRLNLTITPELYVGGSIQRVNLSTGEATTIYTECDGAPLLAPNDLVFDAHGGFWFTDHGTSSPHAKTYGGIFYVTPDGASIRRVRHALLSPNGIGLSPDGEWLYWADTLSARLWRAKIMAPGKLADYGPAPGEVLATAPGNILLDSLAVEASGRICVGSILNGGITIIDPNGATQHIPLDDPMVTNICFGGPDGQNVWITAASTGRLLHGRWPHPGLPLAFSA